MSAPRELDGCESRSAKGTCRQPLGHTGRHIYGPPRLTPAELREARRARMRLITEALSPLERHAKGRAAQAASEASLSSEQRQTRATRMPELASRRREWLAEHPDAVAEVNRRAWAKLTPVERTAKMAALAGQQWEHMSPAARSEAVARLHAARWGWMSPEQRRAVMVEYVSHRTPEERVATSKRVWLTLDEDTRRRCLAAMNARERARRQA